ncbi:MAG: hypothetical protein MUC97_10770 [Bernardetiaceae bacterium]|nr:hypothetical protein [Bernardetiaceae bacterium]
MTEQRASPMPQYLLDELKDEIDHVFERELREKNELLAEKDRKIAEQGTPPERGERPPAGSRPPRTGGTEKTAEGWVKSFLHHQSISV